MAAVVWALLQSAIDYTDVLTVLLIGAIAGVMLHVPAGLGVIEAVFVALLSHRVPEHQLLGALLGYRALFYIVPLLIAALLYLVVCEMHVRRSTRIALEAHGAHAHKPAWSAVAACEAPPRQCRPTWRASATKPAQLLAHQVPPDEVHWQLQPRTNADLFADSRPRPSRPRNVAARRDGHRAGVVPAPVRVRRAAPRPDALRAAVPAALAAGARARPAQRPDRCRHAAGPAHGACGAARHAQDEGHPALRARCDDAHGRGRCSWPGSSPRTTSSRRWRPGSPGACRRSAGRSSRPSAACAGDGGRLHVRPGRAAAHGRCPARTARDAGLAGLPRARVRGRRRPAGDA